MGNSEGKQAQRGFRPYWWVWLFGTPVGWQRQQSQRSPGSGFFSNDTVAGASCPFIHFLLLEGTGGPLWPSSPSIVGAGVRSPRRSPRGLTPCPFLHWSWLGELNCNIWFLQEAGDVSELQHLLSHPGDEKGAAASNTWQKSGFALAWPKCTLRPDLLSFQVYVTAVCPLAEL